MNTISILFSKRNVIKNHSKERLKNKLEFYYLINSFLPNNLNLANSKIDDSFLYSKSNIHFTRDQNHLFSPI